MDSIFDVTLNPLEWHSLTFATLIVIAILLRIALPWRRRVATRVVREVLIFLPAVLFYFLVRGLVGSDYDSAAANAERIINLEQRLGIWVERDLQDLVLGSAWRTDLVNWVYIWAHWPVIAIIVFWLVLRHFDRYPKYRNAMLISGMVGMIIYATYPVAPPRLMPDYGFVDTVTLQSNSYRVLQPPTLANPYAAMPSLHFGWNLLMGIALVRESRALPIRVAGYLVPIAMFLAIVLSANHYILDAVAGGIIVLLSLMFSTWLATVTARQGSFRERFRPGSTPLETGTGPSPVAPGAGPSSHRDVVGPPTPGGPRHKPFVVAHRYGNTLQGLKQAEAAGADILEADVWFHRGRLEIRHTKTLGPLPVLWDRWSIERAGKPRLLLNELLEALDPDTLLMLDVKGRNPEAPGQIIDALDTVHPGNALLVCSQNWDQVERFRNYPGTTLVHSIGNGWQLRRAWQRMERENWDAVSIQARLLDRRVVERLKERVGFVMTWPVNTRERLEQVLDWGVDGFTSDDLDLIDHFTRHRRGARDRRAGLVRR